MEYYDPQTKMNLLGATSAFKPNRRVQKALEKEAEAVKGIACPIHNCTRQFATEHQLESHY